MATCTASTSRQGDYTQPHRCAGCGRTFWAKSTWNRVAVRCPRCGRLN